MTPELSNIPDPSEDRDEFKRRLDGIFEISEQNPKLFQNAIRAILFDDEIEKANCMAEIQKSEGKINGYLVDWDAATNREERSVVVSSVRQD